MCSLSRRSDVAFASIEASVALRTIEAHDAATHLQAHREIIRPSGRAPVLGTLSKVEPAAADGRYARLLVACEMAMAAE
jgi:hypothetical protein